MGKSYPCKNAVVPLHVTGLRAEVVAMTSPHQPMYDPKLARIGSRDL
jgi:hypothetical protein